MTTREIEIVSGMAVIKDPTLIKVKTIKKKHFDQITLWHRPLNTRIEDDGNITFVGRVDQHLIFYRDHTPDVLFRMNFVDLMGSLVLDNPDITKKEGNTIFTSVPQIFLD